MFSNYITEEKKEKKARVYLTSNGLNTDTGVRKYSKATELPVSK